MVKALTISNILELCLIRSSRAILIILFYWEISRSDRECVSFRQLRTQTQRLLGSVALKPNANCQFNLLVPIESLRLKWPLKLHCLGSSDFLWLCTSNSIRRLQKKRSVSIGNELKRCMQPLCLKSSSDCFARILF